MIERTTKAKPSPPAVMPARSALLQRKCACGGTPGPSGECAECRRKRLQQKIRNPKSEIRNNFLVPPIVPDAPQSPGQPLDSARRAFIEPHFGHDFSRVRVHSGAIAEQATGEADHNVYVAGHPIVFGSVRSTTGMHHGRSLIAELIAPRRPAGTDDLTETDLTVPRAEGDAGAAAPSDAGVPGGAPEPSCCDKAFAKGLAASDYGGVICCKNVKHSCVWPSKMSSALTNAKARSISIDCARVHEDTHHDDIDCTGADVERPGFKAGKSAKAEECIAYKAEVACFDTHLADCGEDADCKKQIRDRRAVKQGQADSNCA